MKTNNLYWDSNTSDNFVTPSERDPSYANPNNVLQNVGYRDPVTRELKVGAMPINPDVIVTLGINDRFVISEGYHSGKSIIRANGLREETLGTATEEDIAFNKTAWVNGIRLVGKLNISKNNMDATATAHDILMGKTAWVNGVLVTGDITVHLRKDDTIRAGETYVISEGYHGGEAIIKAMDLASQTQGTATENDITNGKSAWVNGVPVIGTALEFEQRILDATAIASDIRRSKTAYTAFGLTTGEMDEHLNMPPKTILAGTSFTIPEGYSDGLWVVQAASLASQTNADATANDIRKGKSAWVDGILVEGTMIQNYAPNTDATAVAGDITDGKTAWVNGEKITGTNQYDTINFIARVRNIDNPTSPVVITLPEHRWDVVRFIEINVMQNSNIVQSYSYRDYVSYDKIEEYSDDGSNMLLSIISVPGSPKLTITSFVPDAYIDVTIFGYTLIK